MVPVRKNSEKDAKAVVSRHDATNGHSISYKIVRKRESRSFGNRVIYRLGCMDTTPVGSLMAVSLPI